jgi:hypothetical protein
MWCEGEEAAGEVMGQQQQKPEDRLLSGDQVEVVGNVRRDSMPSLTDTDTSSSESDDSSSDDEGESAAAQGDRDGDCGSCKLECCCHSSGSRDNREASDNNTDSSTGCNSAADEVSSAHSGPTTEDVTAEPESDHRTAIGTPDGAEAEDEGESNADSNVDTAGSDSSRTHAAWTTLCTIAIAVAVVVGHCYNTATAPLA